MKIYIIPTRFGLLCGTLLLVMVASGIIYSNNSILLVAFILASLLIALMIETHSQMKGLQIVSFEMSNGFAGGHAELRLLLKNRRRNTIEGFEFFPNSHGSQRVNLGPEDQRLVEVSIPVEKRGRHILKRVRVGTSAPVGLFWAWSYVGIQLEYFGYPQPRGRMEMPDAVGTEGAPQLKVQAGGDDFAGHRLFVAGDSWKRIDWKAVSRGRPWLVKHFGGGEPDHWVFDFSGLQGSTESRLSQLSLWIHRATVEEARFGLNLSNKNIPVSSGGAHGARCLKELAIYDELA